MIKHILNFFGNTILINGNRNCTDCLGCGKYPVELGPIGANNGHFVAALNPEADQTHGQRPYIFGDIRPAKSLPDAILLFPKRRAVTNRRRIPDEQLGKGVERALILFIH